MRVRTLILLVLQLCLCRLAGAGFETLMDHEMRMEFAAARQAALDTVSRESGSADAVAAAAWWEDNLDNMLRPAEILDAAHPPLQPALALILSHIEADISERVPAGVPATVELSGPWGLFPRLDLERQPFPRDIPPPGTVWKGPGSHFHLLLKNESGRARTPPSLSFGGDTLLSWRLRSPQDFSGWMAVEIRGSANLAVDGREIDRIRDPAISSPGLRWYRAHFSAGFHRIDVLMSPENAGWIRLNFIDEDGRPFEWEEAEESPEKCAASELQAADPLSAVEGESLAAARLKYHLAAWKEDPPLERRLVDMMLERWPGEDTAHLTAAGFFLLEQTGAGLDKDYERAHRELEASGEIPLKTMFEYLLARMQRREEDAEKFREELVSQSPSDPRVIRLKVDEAISRSWPREAEEALDELEAAVGPNESVTLLRLDVLKSLEKWDERRSLLEDLAEHSPPHSSLISLVADSCDTGEALDIMGKMQQRILHPSLDADNIRLLMRSGDTGSARKELERAFGSWGRIPLFQDLGLMVLKSDSDAWKELLSQALDMRPQDTDLRELGRRNGLLRPFWEKEYVDAHDFLASAEAPENGVDTALLLDQAVERIFPNGSSLYYYHGLTKALTPEGVTQASVLQTMPDAERLQLRIIKPDGRIVIPARISSSGGRIQIDEVEVGDVVEDEYLAPVSSISSAVAAHLSTYIYRFADPERSFGLSEYALVFPEELEINIDGMFEGLKRSEEQDGQLRIIRFRAEDMPPMPAEHLQLRPELAGCRRLHPGEIHPRSAEFSRTRCLCR